MRTTEAPSVDHLKRRRHPAMLDLGTLGLPLLMDAGVAFGFVGFPLAAIRLGATPLHLGVLGCASPACFVLSCLLFGGLSDRWGRRPATIVGALAYALAFLGAYHAHSLTALIAAAGAIGTAGGLYWPSLEATIADAYGHGPLGRGLLLFNVGWTSGMMMGAMASGRLADAGSQLPFAAGAAVALAALPLLFFWPPRQVPSATQEALPEEGKVAPHVVDHYLTLARIANFSAFFAVVSLRALFPKLATDLGFSGGSIGMLIAITSLAQAVAFIPFAFWRRWQYQLGPFLVAEAMMVMALLGIARVSSAIAFGLLFAVVGAACALTYTASLFYSLNRPADRGKMGALHEAILGSGSVLGPILGGTLAQHAGLRSPYLLAACVTLLVMALQLILRKARAPRP
ncbi:MAG TPA: MFS transporter [Armatimonadota bacterium]|nr:MFS transporter [Armatimonadota bacterium]HOQ29113.1 MFS transporter [Armatimonadota bacterium]HPO73682.1 MFS transporter [Armatimonadota bacterium]HPT97938.1 MFS transporter [Armatimonadota bacterium]